MKRGRVFLGLGALIVAGGSAAYYFHAFPKPLSSNSEVDGAFNGSATESDPSPEDAPLCKLKGQDFRAECAPDQDENSLRITITFNDGKVPEYLESDGKVEHPVTTVFSREDQVKLEKWIPGEPREQMVVEGEDYLPQGQGTIRTRNIYRLDEDGVREVAHLILSREPGEDSPAESRKLTAKASMGPAGVIFYDASIDGEQPQRIELKWDGQRFSDPTGEFEKLSQEFNP